MDLVEQQHKGIFSVLDEACMNVGKVTDEVFLQGLNGKLAKHAHYTSRKVGNAKRRPGLSFGRWLKELRLCVCSCCSCQLVLWRVCDIITEHGAVHQIVAMQDDAAVT